MESKGAKECAETVAKYYERIRDKKSHGAIMFAVCRGKIRLNNLSCMFSYNSLQKLNFLIKVIYII